VTDRALTLANGLRTLLIHDAETEKAALSTTVHVGQLQDGLQTPGRAHLTEHAVFLGSHDFPDTSGLDAYLAQRGGSSNAFTDLEMTCYYMDFGLDALGDVLARWAAAMGRPLLAPEVLGKEIMAVDSEHAKNQQQDVWRLMHLSRTILGAPVEEGAAPHPYATFGSGCKASLLIGEENEDARILVLQEAVADFCRNYYLAPHMTLAVLSNHSLDEMQVLVKEFFESIPSSDQPLPVLPPLVAHRLPTVVQVVPIREAKTLQLQWPMRESLSLYRHKPGRILSHLLGHEGPGSLTAVLREDCHWLQDLYADDSSSATSAFSVFTLHMDLTDSGWENVNHIVRMVYAYLDLLAEIPSWVHDELKTTGDMNFRFLSQHDAMSTVSNITVDMLKYPAGQYLSGAYKVYEDYEPDLVKECWKEMRPDNMLMMITAKEYEATADLTDQWYGTKYAFADIDDAVRETWQTPNGARTFDNEADTALEASVLTFMAKLRLPDPNDMVATNFDLLPASAELFPDKDSPPRCLQDTDVCQLWYKPDTAFKMPKVNLIYCMETTAVHTESPFASVLTSIWVDAVTELCLEFNYAATMAGLYASFSSTRSGLTLDVSGYNHKVPILLQRLVDTARQVATRLTPELFERLREKREKRFLDFLVSQPYRHAMNAAELCIDRPKWDILKRLECVKEVTLLDLQQFAPRLLSRFRLKGLVHGNVTPAEAKSLTQIVLDGFQPKPPLTRPELRVAQLETGEALYRMAGFNKEEPNSCTVSLYQIGAVEVDTNAALSVLSHLLQEPAYSILRTEEQLGYIVFSQIKTNGLNIKHVMILVQGDAYDPIHMAERIEVFVNGFRKTLVEMSAEDFTNNIEAVVQMLTEKKKNLGEEAYGHWQYISHDSLQFDRMKKIAEKVKTTTKEDVLRLFDRYLLAGSPNRRKLTVQTFGSQHLDRMQDPVPSHVRQIDKVDDFVRTVSFLPLPKAAPITDAMCIPAN
jgi:insulysin